MKLVLVLVLALAACVSAVQIDERAELPPGFSSASELASVLANEPAAASQARFAETQAAADVITFQDNGCGDKCGNSDSSSTTTSSDGSDEDAEFDSQIAQIDDDTKKIREQIKETEECARRLSEQKAELRSLEEQKEHLEKEKEKRVLQAKLDKQMRDLSEINRMARALRAKFAELKHTQQLIKTKLVGTRSSLNQLDSEPDMSMDDVKAAPDAIASEMDAMHEAQEAILKKSQQANTKEVKQTITQTDSLNLAARKQGVEQQF